MHSLSCELIVIASAIFITSIVGELHCRFFVFLIGQPLIHVVQKQLIFFLKQLDAFGLFYSLIILVSITLSDISICRNLNGVPAFFGLPAFADKNICVIPFACLSA